MGHTGPPVGGSIQDPDLSVALTRTLGNLLLPVLVPLNSEWTSRSRKMTECIRFGFSRYHFDVFEGGNGACNELECPPSIQSPEKLGEDKAGSDNPDERDAHGTRRQLSKTTAVQSLALQLLVGRHSLDVLLALAHLS